VCGGASGNGRPCGGYKIELGFEGRRVWKGEPGGVGRVGDRGDQDWAICNSHGDLASRRISRGWGNSAGVPGNLFTRSGRRATEGTDPVISAPSNKVR